MRTLASLFAFFFLLSLALVAPYRASAQEYRGTITGLVSDQAGSIIQNASVVASSPEHTYRGKTDAKGEYYIPYVQPGTYQIKVDAPGFKSVAHLGVVVEVSAKVSDNFQLPIGSVSETVTVSENALELSTADASGGTVIDSEKVQNLPLNGRQVYMLMSLTPGVRFTQTQFGPGGYSGTRGWDTSNAYSISGQPGTTNQFLLNGAPISVQGGGPAGTWNISPTIDAVQEFKIMTITFDAQYGRVGGGAVNIILKNGSPHFHGTLYDFWRNSVLDANTFQLNQENEAKPFHNEHQFGGTVGGPFLKHNAFFFFSYEGYRQVLPAGVVTTVPTADLYPGSDGSVDLSSYLTSVGRTGGIYDPETTACMVESSTGCTTYGRQQFAGNIIPANRISSVGLAFMKLFPAPNRSGYTNNYVFNGKDRYRYNMPIARVDYDFTDRTKLYGIFAWWSGHEYRNSNGLVGPAITGDIDNYRSSLTQVLDLTHTFSPRLIGDIRVSFNRYYYADPDGTVSAGLNTLTAGDVGLSMPKIPTTDKDYAPELSLGDNFPNIIGNQVNPNIFETYDVGPSLTHVLGNHNLHYGAEWSLYHDVPSGIGRPNGYFGFGTDFTQENPFQQHEDGSIIANLLLGYSDSGGVDYNIAPYESYRYVAGYVQDDWKISRNLTINAGIRWDEEFSPIERHNRLLAGMCLTCVNPISNSVPSLAPLYGTVLFASSSQPAYPNNTAYWQPKIGLSYGFSRNTVLHAGYTLSKAFGIELGGASAWNESTGYNDSPDGNLHPGTGFIDGNPFPNGYVTPPGNSQGALALVGTGFGIDMRDRKIIHVHQWTLGIQQALPFQMLGEIDYLGIHGDNLRASKQLNALSAQDFAEGHANPNYLDQQVPNPFYGVLPSTVSLGQNPTIQARYLKVPYPAFDGNIYDYTYPGGYSNYDALLAKLEKRFSGTGVLSKGLSFLTSFTWSHLLSATGYLNNNGAGLADPKPYYTTDGGDRPWDLAFSGLWGLPVGRGGALFSDAHGILGQVVNDWQMEWIFQNDGGTPVGFPNGYNYNCGNYNILSTHKSWKSYINNSDSSCFSTFAEYTAVTQLPITTKIRNPWAQQTAIGFEKKFRIREGTTLQFKAEAFNLTNTAIFGGPNTGSPDQEVTRNTSVASDNQPGSWSGYGTIGSTEQNFPRQIQMSLKLQF
ncbi:TonB-dependent receptor [Silvibacterium dinghuense]|uniref:TonB-dependent receptor n=1 Tax=Silvibacterium dinghuense TaxID=1560006 RepID=A0A4Q1S8S3_9BACT|nr:carboxypeptidase regulatory-like domain-containing protein [Silvibacterium dinghuense]RXS93289.1 TonB-dependent receptor [Silvibacterium dinghuense]GGH04593.1 hypothetical protein GCM10011586_20830 [Silvibacterium dinghuense]